MLFEDCRFGMKGIPKISFLGTPQVHIRERKKEYVNNGRLYLRTQATWTSLLLLVLCAYFQSKKGKASSFISFK